MSRKSKLKAGDKLTFVNSHRFLFDFDGRSLGEQIGAGKQAIFLGETTYFNAISEFGVKVLTTKGIHWQVRTDFIPDDQKLFTNLEEFCKWADQATELAG